MSRTGHSSSAAPTLEAITVARVLCICGVVYVHAWLGVSNAEIAASSARWSRLIVYAVREAVGRGSVPLLSIVSGWLVISTIRRKTYQDFISGKARTVLCPMLIWNLIGLAVIWFAAHYGLLTRLMPTDALQAANEILFLYKVGEINVQNAFLRDLFICMLAAPFLVNLSTRLLGTLVLVSIVWTITDLQLYILLRPQILTFFLIGILAYRHRWDRATNRWPIVPVVILATATISMKLLYMFNPIDDAPAWAISASDFVLRIVVAMAFWRVSLALATTSLYPMFVRIEPFSFLVFCSHVLFLYLIGPALGKVFGKFGSGAFLILFLAQPILSFMAAVALGWPLMRIWPWMATTLSGGRLSASRLPKGAAKASDTRSSRP